MEKRIIQIEKEVADISDVDLNTHMCSDGTPVWIDLNVGNWKGPDGNTILELKTKSEYVNKKLIRDLWNKMWNTIPQIKEGNDYAKAINYFLTN